MARGMAGAETKVMSRGASANEEALADDRWIIEHWSELVRDHPSRYVAVHRGRIVATSDDQVSLGDALRRADLLSQAVIAYVAPRAPRVEF